MNRKVFFIGCVLAACLMMPGCKKGEPEERQEHETGSLMDIKLSLPSTLKVKAGQEISLSVAGKVMPLASDMVVLRPVESGSQDVVCSIASIGDSQFTYCLPSKFEFGHYTFCLKRETLVRGFGKITYTSSDGKDIEPAYGSTVYGLVSCGDTPLGGVVVSDGYEVVTTDKDGVYQMASKKKNPYVFISVPSGYEVPSVGVLPLFYSNLVKSASTPERVDFNLSKAGDQTNHTMLFFGDMHLSTLLNDDLKQFATFTAEINNYIKAHPNEKIYAMTLGDMTWDLYWYSRNFFFPEYLREINAGIKGLQIFHTIGNHDHDMKAAGDWDTVAKFKEYLCPNYYSFNVGKVHYVVLDDIECTNDGSGTKESRTFNRNVVSYALEWLKKDLSYVEKSKPVVITMHAPFFSKGGGKNLTNNDGILNIVYGYDVTFVTGHSHLIYNYEKSGVKEWNSGAVCAAWWYPGSYNSALNWSPDGSPAGYRIATVKGTNITSVYKATGRDASYQFRVYDRNKIKVTCAAYGIPSDREEALLAEDYGGYCKASANNEIIINVWDYDPKWKVEAFEGSKALTVSQFTGYDPGYMLAYIIPHLVLKTSVSDPWHLTSINHMFKTNASSATSTVTVKVTDDEGVEYTQKIQRPLPFIADSYK